MKKDFKNSCMDFNPSIESINELKESTVTITHSEYIDLCNAWNKLEKMEYVADDVNLSLEEKKERIMRLICSD